MNTVTTSTPAKVPFRDLSPEDQDRLVEANKKIFDEHFDMEYMRSLNTEIVDYLNLYFRPQFENFDELPERAEGDRPLIYACNHSGMAFPWDAIIFGAGLFHKHQYNLKKLFRPLAAPALSASNLMNPFLLENLWKRVGAVDATSLNFETMMQYEDSHLLIYPEGVPGIGKGFNRKYQLQKFSTSMVRMALKYKTDIIGMSCVNGEYINPWSYSWEPINKLSKKIGIPYVPIGLLTPLLLVQPWLFYYGFPAKLTYIKGNRYNPTEMAGNKAWEDIEEADILRIRDEIQFDMQAQLNKNVERYGKKPFNWKEIRIGLKKSWRHLPYWTPPGWPALFTEYDRRYKGDNPPPTKVVRGWFQFWVIVLKNPIVFAYFIPVLGWIPLIWKGLRGRKEVKSWEGARA